MARGRRPSGPQLVQGLDGTPEAKERATVILETIAGKRSVAEACAVLGVSPAHFYRLRDHFLNAGVTSLEPRPLGRPPQQPEIDPPTQALQDEVRNLRLELVAAQTREQIALVMPEILRPKSGKKNKRQRAKRTP